MKFAILEIGSTNTKACIYEDGNIRDFGQKYIPFKDNYSDGLNENDIQTLCEFIDEVKVETKDIFAFGTSIFRKLSEAEITYFSNKIGVKFEVVSSEDEALYTVNGVINNIDYNGKLGVFIGGGGSTEIVICENKEIKDKTLFDFGVVDITKKFPELKEDKVETPFEEIFDYVDSKIDLRGNADALVLAGGDHLCYYEKTGYECENNFLYKDKNQPFLISYNQANNFDHDMLKKSWDEVRNNCVGNEGWWDGARAMRFCVNAVAKRLGAKYIIPTKINMIMGLANKIGNENVIVYN